MHAGNQADNALVPAPDLLCRHKGAGLQGCQLAFQSNKLLTGVGAHLRAVDIVESGKASDVTIDAHWVGNQASPAHQQAHITECCYIHESGT